MGGPTQGTRVGRFETKQRRDVLALGKPKEDVMHHEPGT